MRSVRCQTSCLICGPSSVNEAGTEGQWCFTGRCDLHWSTIYSLEVDVMHRTFLLQPQPTKTWRPRHPNKFATAQLAVGWALRPSGGNLVGEYSGHTQPIWTFGWWNLVRELHFLLGNTCNSLISVSLYTSRAVGTSTCDSGIRISRRLEFFFCGFTELSRLVTLNLNEGCRCPRSWYLTFWPMATLVEKTASRPMVVKKTSFQYSWRRSIKIPAG